VAFDTSPAAITGSRRAAAGIPLPAVMDAYRVASLPSRDVVVDIATEKRGVNRDMVIQATRRIWRFQNLYTDAMASAIDHQNMEQVLEDEAERAALTEALLDGRNITDYSVWEVAQLLRLPLSGPYVVIAAECPMLGKQALPGISAKLRAVDIFSAWRLLPDIRSASRRSHRAADVTRCSNSSKGKPSKRVGVSPQFHELTNTAQALRYARVALNARSSRNGAVTVFDNSVLAIAAVSAPEVAKRWHLSSWASSMTCQPTKRMSSSDTFRAWLANKGSFTNAAAQLHVHSNTVRHRLHRIERQTDRSLWGAGELAEMCLSVTNEYSRAGAAFNPVSRDPMAGMFRGTSNARHISAVHQAPQATVGLSFDAVQDGVPDSVRVNMQAGRRHW